MTECKIGFIPKIRKCQNRHFSSVCPEKEPMIGEPCSLPSDVGPCSYGSECCCGECHPRSILDKSRCLRMGSFFLISNCQEAYFQLMLLLSILFPEKLKVPISEESKTWIWNISPPSLKAECIEGRWEGFNTDACMRPQCTCGDPACQQTCLDGEVNLILFQF